MRVEDTNPWVTGTNLCVENTTILVCVEHTNLRVEDTDPWVSDTYLCVEHTNLHVDDTNPRVSDTNLCVEDTNLCVEDTNLRMEDTNLRVENSLFADDARVCVHSMLTSPRPWLSCFSGHGAWELDLELGFPSVRQGNQSQGFVETSSKSKLGFPSGLQVNNARTCMVSKETKEEFAVLNPKFNF